VNCIGWRVLQKTFKDLKNNLKSPAPLLGWVIATFVCAAVGPFGTYQSDTLSFRILFWGGIILIAIIYALFCLHAAHNIWPKRSFLKIAPISSIFFTITFSIPVKLLTLKIYTDPQPSLLLIILIVGSITTTIAIFMHIMAPPETETLTSQPILKSTLKNHKDNPFLSRINSDIETKLIRMTMRDHYVEVHTNQGKQLIYERFSDAVAALSEFNGHQIHRSHWVNFEEINNTVKKDNTFSFEMSDGFGVPIARSKVKELKAMGVLP